MVKLIYKGVMSGNFILKGGLWSGAVIPRKVYDIPNALLDEFLRSGSWEPVGELPKVKESKIKPKSVTEVKKEKPKVENIRLRCNC